MAFDKIEESDLTGKGTTNQPDVPTIPSTDQKRVFEEILRDVSIPFFNALIDSLKDELASETIGAQTLTDTPTTVQALLDTINFGGKEAETTITDDDNKIPTSSAIVEYVVAIGAGDMLKAIYDTDNSGVVDNAETLEGNSASDFATSLLVGANDISGIADGTATGANVENSTRIDTAETKRAVIGGGLLTNGNFGIWQRGITFTNEQYIADMWETAGGNTSSRIANTNNDISAKYALQVSMTTAAYLVQKIENPNNVLYNKKSVLSFWVKADVAMTAIAQIGLGGSSTIVQGITYNVTTSWTKVELTFDADVSWTNDDEIWLFLMRAPSTTTATMQFAQVKFELGEVATDYISDNWSDQAKLSGLSTVLWENPSPLSSFAGQTVTLSEDIEKYDYYEIEITSSAGSALGATTGKIPTDKQVRATFPASTNNLRSAGPPSGTSLLFGNALQITTYGDLGVTDNNLVVPIRILGYKTK